MDNKHVGRFILRDRIYAIDDATIELCFYEQEHAQKNGWGDHAQWRLEINIGTEEQEWEEETFGLNVGLGEGKEIVIDQLNSWESLENYTFETSPDDFPFVGTFEDDEMTSSTISIGSRNGNYFQLKWSGLCNIYWTENYTKDIPFEMECTAEFIGISGDIDDLEKNGILWHKTLKLVKDKDNIMRYKP